MNDQRACSVCGEPIRSCNRYGICQRNPKCRRAYILAYEKVNWKALAASAAVTRKANRFWRSKIQRAYYAANREAILKRREARRARLRQQRRSEP